MLHADDCDTSSSSAGSLFPSRVSAPHYLVPHGLQVSATGSLRDS